MLKRYIWLIYLPVSLFVMELTVKLWCFGSLSPKGVIFTLLFSAALGCACSMLSCAVKGRFKPWIFSVLLFAFGLVFGTQAVYHRIFKAFFTLYSLGGAAGALGSFWREALTGIYKSLPVLAVIFAPALLWLVLGRRLAPKSLVTARFFAAGGLLAVLFHTAAVTAVTNSVSGVMPAAYLYRESFVPDLSVYYFGVMTTARMDVRQLMASEEVERAPEQTAAPDAAASQPSAAPSARPQEPEPVDDSPNIMDINFESLIGAETNSAIRGMHEYFAAREPTNKNEYTGMFEGKNLIWIVAEGFSSLALSETHTPTLTKLSREGFTFENFYNPLWGVSTSDGEYVTLSGLLPKSGVWSFSKSSKNLLPMAFGNQLRELGYNTLAYHNHYYTYYDRHLSHPNMGYDYYGLGNGLKVTEQWPESDLEMVEVTAPDFIGTEPFHVYYLTVSGHLYYNFYGNVMAAKHEQAVADLPYSTACRAYIACNMEFDLAVEKLIAELDAAGILDDTVIVISGDHYPYGLEISEIEELYGGKIDTAFELYRSTLIIWSSAMKQTVNVDKYCSSLDIMPTLSNLFGLEYDSRLVMGRDILSDSEALVVFSNRSFITDKGRYDAQKDVFTANEGAESDADYARSKLAEVKDMFTYSAAILDNDYYRYVIDSYD